MTPQYTLKLTSRGFNHNLVNMSINHPLAINNNRLQGAILANVAVLHSQRLIPTPTAIQEQQQPNREYQQHRLAPTQATAYAVPLHTATAAATIFNSLELAVEPVMSGIFLTKNFIAWNEQNLRAHGFTHIIIIDKHIQELYYPSPVFKLSSQSPPFAHGNVDEDPFDYYYPSANTTSLSFGKEFEAIDLNFGDKSYLTTVLPNCYRAVKFINKALQAGGTILVIDCNGGEQKCVTIVVAYLMYKHNISFSNAFARLKDCYKKADLDRFYISQLYEYEPILQVQRAQSRGHSCSRELHSAILKRKKDDDDVGYTTPTSDFFDTLNPLSQFIITSQTTQEQQDYGEKPQPHTTQQDFAAKQHNQQLVTIFSRVGDSYNTSTWDDYAME